MKKFIIFTILLLFLNNDLHSRIYADNIEIFKKSKIYELALAVEDNDYEKVQSILNKDSSLVNETDSYYGTTLLHWVIYDREYKMAELLLKNGANPHFHAHDGGTPLQLLLGYEKYPAIFYFFYCHGLIDYLKLFIIYGADVNHNDLNSTYKYKGVDGKDYYLEPYKASAYNYPIFKYLVEQGMKYDAPDVLFGPCLKANIELIHYLIIDKKVKIPHPISINSVGDTLTFLYYMRLMIFSLSSDEYKLKMEVVNYIKKEYNLDYWKEPIPSNAKFLLKGKSKEYLEKY